MLGGGTKTNLRCITSSSAKILSSQGGGWIFANFESIDVIVTDRDVLTFGQEFLKHAHDYGVLVVTNQMPASLPFDPVI